jgi:23S rRNA (cytidine1920-2'-O)/16S rRNA (cytidine1409-2'-O)-methyltransferase
MAKAIVDKKDRLDKVIVQLGLAPTRAKARALILAGSVMVEGCIVDKAGALVQPGSTIEVTRKNRFVSRGGDKLECALRCFRPEIGGKIALDVGASTGGFTDCLLRQGARKIYCVDVGYGQLDWQLRADPRVVVLERTNARNLTPRMFDEPPEFATIDASFISLTLLLRPVADVLTDDGELIALIKPQFEAGREQVGKGGVVRDPAVHLEVINKIENFAGRIGLYVVGTVESALQGPAGNKEFFVYLKKKRAA